MNRIGIVAIAFVSTTHLWAGSAKQDPGQIGRRNVAGGVNFYSLEKETALGRELSIDLERASQILWDPVITEYVNRLGQNLARNSDAKFPITIKVIRSEEVNAQALPGGFLYINTALILTAETEAQLAGAMAHEIAHVAARHGTRQATRGTIFEYGSIPLVLMGGWAGYAVREGARIAIPIALAKFSRGAEAEADMLGLQYMYSAGYDPAAYVEFFETLETLNRHEKTSAFASFLANHPRVRDRLRSTQKQIQKSLAPREEYVYQTSEFANVRARLQLIEKGRSVPWVSYTPPADTDVRPVLKRRD